MNQKVHKERRITKRTKIRRAMINDKKSFCQITLQNLIIIYTKVYKKKYFGKIQLWGSKVMF